MPIDEDTLRRLRENDKTLTKIELIDIHMGDNEAEVLAEALKENTVLTELALMLTEIGDKGAKALAVMLSTNMTIKVLEMPGNLIGIAGAEALANMLTINSALTMLNIVDGGLDIEGAEVLAKALEKNTTLINFSIGVGWLGDSGFHALTKALAVNNTLISLGITYYANRCPGPSLTRALANDLVEVLENNFTLRYFKGGSSPKLTAMLERNRQLNTGIRKLVKYLVKNPESRCENNPEKVDGEQNNQHAACLFTFTTYVMFSNDEQVAGWKGLMQAMPVLREKLSISVAGIAMWPTQMPLRFSAHASPQAVIENINGACELFRLNNK